MGLATTQRQQLSFSRGPPPSERGYRGVTSSPVPLNLEDLTLDRAQPASDSQANDPGSRPSSRLGSMHDLPSALGGGPSESEGNALSSKCLPGCGQFVASHEHLQTVPDGQQKDPACVVSVWPAALRLSF